MKRLLPSAFLLMLVSWIVVGFAVSGGAVSWSNPLSPEAVNLLSASIRSLVLTALLGFMVLILVVMVVTRRDLIDVLKEAFVGPERAPRRRSWLGSLLSAIFTLVVLFFIFYFWKSPAEPEGVDGGPSFPPSGGAGADGNATSTSWPFLPQPSASTSLAVGYAAGIMLLAIGVVGALIMFQAMRETSWGLKELPPDDLEESVKESALEAVQEAIHRIEREGDFRAAVIRCYRRLCETLDEHGVPREKCQTAREYESAVSEILDIPEDPVSTLTDLFEEARYSLHEIGEGEQSRALGSLVDIRDHLSGVSGDV